MPESDPDALAIEVVRESPVFVEFSRAFRKLSSLPLNLVSALPLESRVCFACDGRENSFCAKITATPVGADACLRIQNDGRARAHHHAMPAATRCFSGLIDLYVPVVVHGHHAATLVSGQVAQRKLTPSDFKPVADLLKKWRLHNEAGKIRRALLASNTVDYFTIDACLEVLKLFALELSRAWEQLVSLPKVKISNSVQKGLDLVRERFTDPKLDMKTAAKTIGLNHFYFCKIFKKEAGVGFLEYLNRERVRNAQKLLANPGVRIKEIVYKSGFQSIATFNRVFKKHSGVSPSRYRRHLFSAPSEV